MAKVYPAAELPTLDDDLPLTDEEFHRLSFIARLSRDRREKLLKYPGAMRLRHYYRGEIICQQNAPGSTAFFILRDVDWLRVLSMLMAKDDARARKGVARLDAFLKTLDPATLKRLEERYAVEQELYLRREELLKRLDDRSAAEAQLKKLMQEAEKKQDKDKAALLKNLLASSPERKKEWAESVRQVDPDTARLLLDTALSPDEVKGLQKEEEFLRTADVDAKRIRAKELVEKDARLASLLQASAEGDEKPGVFADVYLTTAATQARSTGFFGRLAGWFGGNQKTPALQTPRYLPSDGPSSLDFQTRRATLLEGDLFGEMACLNRRPRSATVKAAREGLVLEILSNVLDEIDKDPDYQKERQAVYRRRVLETHLRELALFNDLSPADYAQVVQRIRDRVELVSFSSGQVICDEHDRSDCIYLVRDGIVQVVKNISALLRPEDIRDAAKLAEQAKAASGAAAAALKLLPPAALKLLQDGPGGKIDEARLALNELIKSPKLGALPETKTILDSEKFRKRGYYLPVERKTWTETDLRRGQRLLLEELFPGVFEPLAPPMDSDLILTYLSPGEVFGEIGVVGGIPRTATCVAYGQPRMHSDQKDLGKVELVRIGEGLVRELMEQFPVLKERIAAIIEVRRLRTRHALQERALAVDAIDPDQQSAEAARLGLIQGQRLMLIDLERCTRCDECVKACVDSHDDGRTRLFLAGPRFGKYLAPFTCRSCLDPVCLIGCPVRSIQRGDNLEIQIKDWCIGCGICARQCPYNSIQIHPLGPGEGAASAPEGGELVELRGRAAVCDLCSTLPDQDPRCVYACPHEAAMRVDFRKEFSMTRSTAP